MIRKTYLEHAGGVTVRVTFQLPNSIQADKIYLVGDFNDWHYTSHPMLRSHDGGWILALDLELGQRYQFRYLCDGSNWMNDGDADGYEHNEFGTSNFVVDTGAPG